MGPYGLAFAEEFHGLECRALLQDLEKVMQEPLRPAFEVKGMA